MWLKMAGHTTMKRKDRQAVLTESPKVTGKTYRLMTYNVQYRIYILIFSTLGPCNFTLDIFQLKVIYY